MNLEHLTAEEIIQYVEAGVVDSIPAFVVLKLVAEIDRLNALLKEEHYEKGWNDALEEIADKVWRMQH